VKIRRSGSGYCDSFGVKRTRLGSRRARLGEEICQRHGGHLGGASIIVGSTLLGLRITCSNKLRLDCFKSSTIAVLTESREKQLTLF
jgi:hypothetical protein